MKKLGVWVDFQQKIICSELRLRNLISFSEWAYDASDCAQRFSKASYLGYRIWAVPCMRLMRKHPSLSRALAVVVRWMVADIKHERGVSSQPHWMGKVVRRGMFWPVNRLIGYIALLLCPQCIRIQKLIFSNPYHFINSCI